MATIVKEEVFEDFAELAQEYGCYASPDYSGRGMYGKTCLSVSGSTSDLHTLMYRVVRDGGELADLLEAAPSHDAMGLGVVHYWRGIQVEGSARDGWC